MKAVVIHQHGSPEVLRYETVRDPSPRSNELVVRVKACAMNHLDLWARKGIAGITLPRIMGSDVAGIVESLGAEVSGWKAGDPVVISPGISCGQCQACLSGLDNLCRQYSVLGMVWDGGYAEKLRIPVANVMLLPEGMAFEEAAAVPLVFLTAWHMLVSRAQLKPGEHVLVLGASSGVGSAAIQVARLIGASVLATAGNAEKMKEAERLGARAVFDHYRPDWHEQVRASLGGRGVEVVVEHVGSATFEKSITALAHNGRLVTCGATSGSEAKFDIRVLFYKHLSFLGSFMGTKGEMAEVMKFVRAGQLRPVVDRVFPLAEARQAHEYLQSSQHFGKVVLVP